MTELCSKCSSPLETGYLYEHTLGPEAITGPSGMLLEWQPGEPEALRRLGSATRGPIKRKLPVRRVFATRCTQCGHLELYAR